MTVETASWKLVRTWTETVVYTLFRSESRGKRDRDQNVVQSLRDKRDVETSILMKNSCSSCSEVALAKCEVHSAHELDVLGCFWNSGETFETNQKRRKRELS